MHYMQYITNLVKIALLVNYIYHINPRTDWIQKAKSQKPQIKQKKNIYEKTMEEQI